MNEPPDDAKRGWLKAWVAANNTPKDPDKLVKQLTMPEWRELREGHLGHLAASLYGLAWELGSADLCMEVTLNPTQREVEERYESVKKALDLMVADVYPAMPVVVQKIVRIGYVDGLDAAMEEIMRHG